MTRTPDAGREPVTPSGGTPVHSVGSLDQLLTRCLHCGLCLPVCPTYSVTGREDASPRGRIRLIREYLAGNLELSPEFVEAMYFCLDCQACQTACPAGVEYGTLVEQTRNTITREEKEPYIHRMLKRVLLATLFTSRKGRRTAAALLRLYERSGLRDAVVQSGILSLLPRGIAARHDLLPTASCRDFSESVEEILPARGARKGRVALLTGCLMDSALAEVHADCAAVLQRNGYDVVVPKRQGCCGSVHGHYGEGEEAKRLARATIDYFARWEFDHIIVDSAGCAAFIKEYGTLLADDPAYAVRAAALSRACREATEFLYEAGFDPPGGIVSARVTYHEACHLVHTQHISEAPRSIIRKVPGIEFVELPEATWCCGSAGLYNVLRFEDGLQFLDRKMRNVAAANPDIIVTANPGCHLQLQCGIRREGSSRRVMHPVSLLRKSYDIAEQTAHE